MEEKVFYSFSPEGFYPTVYYEWEEKDAGRKEDTLLCVHGMARTGRDFDYLAQALQAHYRVVCPDLVGRGKSHRFKTRDFYKVEQYLADLTASIARLDVSALDWLGASMGGVLGMVMAAQPHTPIRRLILNDVGPQMPQDAVDRILGYIGIKTHFLTRAQGQDFLRLIYTPFGITQDAHWQHLFDHTLIEDPEGGYTLNYDPQIVGAMDKEKQSQGDLWDFWDKVTCPVLVIHGEDSDILTNDILALMRTRGPKFDVIKIPHCGHVPMLFERDQIVQVTDWMEMTRPQTQL